MEMNEEMLKNAQFWIIKEFFRNVFNGMAPIHIAGDELKSVFYEENFETQGDGKYFYILKGKNIGHIEPEELNREIGNALINPIIIKNIICNIDLSKNAMVCIMTSSEFPAPDIEDFILIERKFDMGFVNFEVLKPENGMTQLNAWAFFENMSGPFDAQGKLQMKTDMSMVKIVMAFDKWFREYSGIDTGRQH